MSVRILIKPYPNDSRKGAAVDYTSGLVVGYQIPVVVMIAICWMARVPYSVFPKVRTGG